MRRVDLNLLYILREMLREPNTTKVGAKLGLTQSAISASLGRLRWAFQDELFVRAGRGMAPTRRAEELLEPVENIIRQIESLVEEVHFDPSQLQRTFTVSATDFVQAALTGPLAAALHETSPSVKITNTGFLPDTRARARSGHLDLLIAPVAALSDEASLLSGEDIYTDRLVAAFWEGNKAIEEPLSEQAYLDARHIEYNPLVGGWQSTMQRFFIDSGLRINTAAEFNSLVGMMHGLVGTDLIATVPGKLVETIGAAIGVRCVELPFEQTAFTVRMNWHRNFDNDPEHQWFRDVALKTAHSVFGKPESPDGAADTQ